MKKIFLSQIKNIAILFLLSFISCDNEKVDVKNTNELQNDIYLCGHENNYPTFWKNNVQYNLENNGKNGDVLSIKVIDNNVYCLGFLSDSSGIISRHIWKNNSIFITLDVNFLADDFAIDGNDIYIIGSVFNPQFGHYQGKIWKNGVMSNLTTSGKEAFASIIINNHNVYIAGYIYIGNNSYAAYWKNGMPTILTTNSTTGFGINSIEVFDNDVYVAGFDTNTSNTTIAKYWKNGVPISLTNGNFDAAAGTIRIANNNIYINGVESDSNGNDVLKYWRNGVEYTLTNGNYYYSKTSSMEVIGNDVISIGYSEDFAINATLYNYNGSNLFSKYNSAFNDLFLNQY